MNISKDIRSEDFKADLVCSIITENRSRDSEPKRGIFFKRKYVILNYFHISCHGVTSNKENRRGFHIDKRFIIPFTQIPVACCDVLIELSSLLGGFSLSPASALRLIFLTNELQVIKSHKRLEKSVKS